MIRPPSLQDAPPTYTIGFFNTLISELRSYFTRINNPYAANLSSLNLNINSLPTEATLATMVSGTVYRDTTAGNVLKVKP